jgi:hypothetical protein
LKGCNLQEPLERRLFRLWHLFRGDPGARDPPHPRGPDRQGEAQSRSDSLPRERYLDAHNRDVCYLAMPSSSQIR